MTGERIYELYRQHALFDPAEVCDWSDLHHEEMRRWTEFAVVATSIGWNEGASAILGEDP